MVLEKHVSLTHSPISYYFLFPGRGTRTFDISADLEIQAFEARHGYCENDEYAYQINNVSLFISHPWITLPRSGLMLSLVIEFERNIFIATEEIFLLPAIIFYKPREIFPADFLDLEDAKSPAPFTVKNFEANWKRDDLALRSVAYGTLSRTSSNDVSDKITASLQSNITNLWLVAPNRAPQEISSVPFPVDLHVSGEMEGFENAVGTLGPLAFLGGDKIIKIYAWFRSTFS